jgi:putative heme degradation protein
MTWVFTRDWPIIFGGKPYWSVPAFIPITFELTVLFASIGMVVTYYAVNGQGPGVINPILDDRITDDKFCVAFDVTDSTDDKVESYQQFFKETGASEVKTKTI